MSYNKVRGLREESPIQITSQKIIQIKQIRKHKSQPIFRGYWFNLPTSLNDFHLHPEFIIPGFLLRICVRLWN